MAAINTPRILHGFTLSIGSGGATATRLTAHNSSGDIGGLLSLGGSGGVTAEIATTNPLDSTLVVKRKGIQNPGQMTFELLRDDNDEGQILLLAAARHATNQFPFFLSGGGGSIAFEGYVTAHTNPGGGSGDFQRVSVTVELTTIPS